jgi:pimeloyl-ACP methyl ester carboxylesterase
MRGAHVIVKVRYGPSERAGAVLRSPRGGTSTRNGHGDRVRRHAVDTRAGSCAVPDVPGGDLHNRDAGRSSNVSDLYTIADMADDVAALMDALDIERAHLLGLSMGGSRSRPPACRRNADNADRISETGFHAAASIQSWNTTALDPCVAPGGILFRHPDNEMLDLLEHAPTTRPANICPLPRDQLSAPENRVGCDDRRDLTEPATAHPVPMRGQPTAFFIGETDPATEARLGCGFPQSDTRRSPAARRPTSRPLPSRRVEP